MHPISPALITKCPSFQVKQDRTSPVSERTALPLPYGRAGPTEVVKLGRSAEVCAPKGRVTTVADNAIMKGRSISVHLGLERAPRVGPAACRAVIG